MGFDRQINTRPKVRNFFDDSFFTQDPFFTRKFDALDFFENDRYETQSLRPMKLCRNKRRNGLFSENSLFKDFDKLLSLENISNNANFENSKNLRNSTGFSLNKRSVTKDGENVTTIDRMGNLRSSKMVIFKVN